MTTDMEDNQAVVDFMRQVVAKLSPEVLQVIIKKDNGKFEIHFSNGQLTRCRKDVTI